MPRQKVATTRARAPLRLGLAGGGTDLSPYCEEFGGAVLNCTIDRFAYAFITPRTDGSLSFRARDLKAEETFAHPCEVRQSRLALHRGVYQRMMRDYNAGAAAPITLTTTVDAPLGSGLGSSSALTVALIEAFVAYFNLPLGEYDIAHLALDIERVDLNLPGGKQDQYAAAFGGVNFIEFLPERRVIVNPLRVATHAKNEFETSLVICFAGGSRASGNIIRDQTHAMTHHAPQAMQALHQLKQDALEMKRALLLGRIDELAAILARSWTAKKATAAAVSNQRLEQLYQIAQAHGAMGGKVSGAGGGGFMMFVIDPADRLGLIDALNEAGANAGPVKLSERGCESWQV